jgi:hypothetical protein
MKRSALPTILKIFRCHAHTVREVARSHGISFLESEIVDWPDAVQFTFDVEFGDAQEFLSALPAEAFAQRGIMSIG